MLSIERVLRENEALKNENRQLHAHREALRDEHHILQEQSTQLLSKLEKEKRKVEALERELRRALARFRGGSEKLDPAQLALAYSEAADDAQVLPHAGEAPDDEEGLDAPPKEKQQQKRKKRERAGRQPLPDHLPRERVVHEPAACDRTCSCCGGEMTRIGEEITETLDYRPASLIVIEHVRPKYACKKHPDEGVRQASLPDRVIDKGRPGPGLLSHIVTSKYTDHLPLHRLEGIFERFGVTIARSTMCDWIRDVAFQLRPIALAIKRSVLASRVVQTDETVVRMQENWRKGGASNCRIWSYVGEHAEVYYDFTLTREGVGPATFFVDYEGYIQADAASTFDQLFKDGKRIEVGCWAHARRKFYEAMDFEPQESSRVLALIQLLYKVEADGRGDPQKLDQLRRTQSAKILESIRETIDELRVRPTQKDPLTAAANYVHNHWSALSRYIKAPYLAIDNNACERSLRRVAVGRKNWLFAGSRQGGQRAATLYTLVESCRLQHVDTFEYIRDVLLRIMTHPSSRIDELTPRGWKAARAEQAAPATAIPA